MQDGSRRRTPGGVFIQLLKTDPNITKDQLDQIFEEELKFGKQEKKKKKKKRKGNFGKAKKQERESPEKEQHDITQTANKTKEEEIQDVKMFAHSSGSEDSIEYTAEEPVEFGVG